MKKKGLSILSVNNINNPILENITYYLLCTDEKKVFLKRLKHRNL